MSSAAYHWKTSEMGWWTEWLEGPPAAAVTPLSPTRPSRVHNCPEHMAHSKPSLEDVLAAFDVSITKLNNLRFTSWERSIGWTEAKRDHLVGALLAWRRSVAEDPELRRSHYGGIIRWFFDNDVDTDGPGLVVLRIDGLLREARVIEETQSAQSAPAPPPLLFRRRDDRSE